MTMYSIQIHPRKLKSIQSVFVIALLIGPLGCLSGCSTLSNLNGPSQTPIAAPSAGTYQVELSGGFSKESVYKGTLDGPITVQTALERSGAIKKFRDMDVTILRVVEESGRGLRMPIEYLPGKKWVSPENDYAILPNDRILVESVSNNLIDIVVDSVTGK
jgi:hypothetical protein